MGLRIHPASSELSSSTPLKLSEATERSQDLPPGVLSELSFLALELQETSSTVQGLEKHLGQLQNRLQLIVMNGNLIQENQEAAQSRRLQW